MKRWMTRRLFAMMAALLTANGCAQVEVIPSDEEDGPDGSGENGTDPAPSCTDGIQNGDETGVDCGGRCAACALPVQARIGQIVIAEILNHADTSDQFVTVGSRQTEFVELYNRTDTEFDLGGYVVECAVVGAPGDVLTIPVSGSIRAHNAAVFANEEISGLPETVPCTRAIPALNYLLNNSDYLCTLKNAAGASLHTVYAPSVGPDAPGESVAMPDIEVSAQTTTNLAAHGSLSRLPHSPGKCSNGGLYENNCLTHCDNGLKDADESDVNCGGALCRLCMSGMFCTVDGDCESGRCLDNGRCAFTCSCSSAKLCDPYSGLCWSCADGIRNGDESDTDCGGACGNTCADGKTCQSGDDCASGSCDAGRCISCSDGVRNGDESDTDCGGSCENTCADGKMCQSGDDCASGSCDAGRCISCSDGIRNGDESDTDCGGSCADKCSGGHSCIKASDCLSNRCEGGTCVLESCRLTGCPDNTHCDVLSGACISCFDGIKNGDEGDVDCGGSCDAKCSDGKRCRTENDCESAICSGVICISCFDGLRNGDETGTDCGGSCDAKCGDRAGCAADSDCISGICDKQLLTCASCTDGIRDGNETDIDCGSACGIGCADSLACSRNADCEYQHCVDNVCISCFDGVKNGSETDVDCGGSGTYKCSARCGDLRACVNNADCSSGKCVDNVCISCFDGVKNGDETDRDCGGSCDAKCAENAACSTSNDCLSQVCASGKCIGEPLVTAGQYELLVNEALGASFSGASNVFYFDAQQTLHGENVRQCRFVEIVSNTSSRRSLSGWKLNVKRLDTNKVTTVDLSSLGVIEPHHVIVVGECADGARPTLPDDATWLRKAELGVTNSASADIWLSRTENNQTLESLHFSLTADTSGNSQNRQADLSPSASIVFHNTISTFNSSPGYCTNGKQFSSLCQ